MYGAALIRAVFVGLCLTMIGCAPFAKLPEPGTSSLPPAKMSSDSVVLEIAFAHQEASDTKAYESIWELADEQHFPAELREKLYANGLRVGVLSQNLPPALRTLLDGKDQWLEQRAEDVSTTDTETPRTQRRLQCRHARRAKVVVSKTYDSLSLLTFENGQVHGRLVEKAQCLFGLKPYLEGDGRVRLDMTPEVEHGELKSQWVGQEGSLLQRIGRERLVMEELRWAATLAPGQVLIVSTTADLKGLGQRCFSETAGGTLQRTILAIRVAQTQHDDLFAPDQLANPLSTPGE